MGTRRYLVGGLITALAAASVSAIALGAAGRRRRSTGSHRRQLPNKKNKRKPIALRVITTTGNPQAANGVPSPATKASIDFDNAGRVYPGVTPKCSESQVPAGHRARQG